MHFSAQILNYTFRTLNRKQTFLLKGKIHPIKGACGDYRMRDKWFIYRDRMGETMSVNEE